MAALLFFAGGAIVNVTVSIAYMVFPRVENPRPLIDDVPTEAEQAWWSRAAPRNSPQHSAIRALNGHAFGVHVREMMGNQRVVRSQTTGGDGVSTIDIQTLYDKVVHLRVGWPLKSFSAERWTQDIGSGDTKPTYGRAPGNKIEGDMEVGGVSIDRAGLFGAPELRIIAYRPMPAGFIVGSLFYAAVLGIIL